MKQRRRGFGNKTHQFESRTTIQPVLRVELSGKRPLVAPLQELVKHFVKYSANEHTYIDRDNNIPSVFRSSTYYSYQRENGTEEDGEKKKHKTANRSPHCASTPLMHSLSGQLALRAAYALRDAK